MKNKLSVLFVILLCCGTNDEAAQGNQISNEELYIASDFTDAVFTSGIEGPAVDLKGMLYVVNYKEKGTIGMVDHTGLASLWVGLPEGSTGNGIRFGKDGNMYVADYTGHNVLKINMLSRKISVHAHEPGMAQPNDLAIMGNDIIFASDPNWKNSTGSIWRINTDGEVSLLEKDMGTTNGIEVSPDDDRLYVNESVQRNVWVYDLDPEGNIRNKRLFHKFEDFGMDGMRCDIKGNLYVTRYGKGTIAILSPDGKLVREVSLSGKNTSNIAFGGPDGRTCFVTLQDRKLVEVFRAMYPGRGWKLINSK
jgi:sugar lactone lactonase YvrE